MEDCMRHSNNLHRDRSTFVPMVSIMETDLVMKGRRYTSEQRRVSWQALRYKVPGNRIIPNTVSSMLSAIKFQEDGMDYFDSFIASLALELGASVVTTDRAIRKVVATEW